MLLEEILGIRFRNRRSKLASESGQNRKTFLEFSYPNLKATRRKGTTISV